MWCPEIEYESLIIFVFVRIKLSVDGWLGSGFNPKKESLFNRIDKIKLWFLLFFHFIIFYIILNRKPSQKIIIRKLIVTLDLINVLC